MEYTINYHTGAGNEVIESDDLAEVMAEADKGAAYTQESITIEDESGKEVARRPWSPVLEGLEDCSDPIQFGDFGYYGDWYEL